MSNNDKNDEVDHNVVVEVTGARVVRKPSAGELESVGVIRRVSDGSPMNQQEINATRAILNSGEIMIDPKAEEEMAKIGITKDDIIAMMLKSLGGRQ